MFKSGNIDAIKHPFIDASTHVESVKMQNGLQQMNKLP